MKKALTFVLLFLFGTEFVLAQQPLPITRILLYKNGMAYIVRAGQLTTPISLTFHPEDMNDVLKTFTAWNPASGALYSVGYTAGIPTSHALGRFPFDITGANVGLGGFLSQVKGAELRLSLGAATLEGKLAAIQQTDRVVTQQTTNSTASDHRLTLVLRDGSLQTVWLSDVRSVSFVDAQLRDQLTSYLDVVAEGRQDVTRDVSIYPVPATGPINVAYLQQFPLWKTSYRLDLGARESRIQGWAQIDNPTGESWNNVQVSLLSGAPVSFVMNLYDPLYTNRSTVAVPGGIVASPRQYEAAVRTAAESTVAAGRGVGGASAPAGGGRGGAGGGAGGRGGVAGGLVAAAPPPPPPLQAFRESAPSFQTTEAVQVEDFFEYTFPFPVQLASRQSALLPFLQKTLNVERLSVYNARADRGNPRLGAHIDNSTDIPFEPGPVTFFEEGRYAGEAVLDYLSRGEKRIVSYGIDHDVQVATKQQAQPETTTRLAISKGVAVMFRESIATTTYEIRNKGSKKTLIVEHPRSGGRTLKALNPWETTDSFYRFRVTLADNQATELPVVEVVGRQMEMALQSITRDQLVFLAAKDTPQSVREKLGDLVDLQEHIAALEADLRTTNTNTESLYRDQARLRENIMALRDTREEQELRKRYLDQLSKQEDQVQAARAHVEAVTKDLAAAEKERGDLISNLTWRG